MSFVFKFLFYTMLEPCVIRPVFIFNSPLCLLRKDGVTFYLFATYLTLSPDACHLMPVT
jgi:hypothetical protein